MRQGPVATIVNRELNKWSGNAPVARGAIQAKAIVLVPFLRFPAELMARKELRYRRVPLTKRLRPLVLINTVFPYDESRKR